MRPSPGPTACSTTAESDPKQLIQLLAEFANADVPLTAPFVEEFYARLQAQGPAMAFVQTWVEQKLLEQGVTAAQLSEAAGRTAATNQISIANSIGSLRFIGAMDWRDYVESLSVVEQTLREDPPGMHASQDFATRDRYRHVIEDVARRSERSEIAVAREAIALAQAAAAQRSPDDRSAHVGYYLIDRRTARSGACGRLPRAVEIADHQGKPACPPVPVSLPHPLLTALATAVVLLPFHGFAPGDWRDWLFALAGVVERLGTGRLAGEPAGHAVRAAARIAAPGFFQRHPGQPPHHGDRPDPAGQPAGAR